MEQIKTSRLGTDQAGIDQAVAIWRNGGLVAFPTETVYGLGADACDGQAVAKIFTAKNRPAFNPLIIHVADIATAQKYAVLNGLAEDLANAFWPGPLSLVLPLRSDSSLSPLVTAGLNTVAVRIPENPLAQHLLADFGGAIAAPSANPSGRISATNADHVLNGLSGRIDAVIDGGNCAVGLESTILFPGAASPALLRPGGLPAEAIEAMLGKTLARSGDPDQPISPGQLASHYAPRMPLRLNVSKPEPHQLWLGFGPDCKTADLNLSLGGDLHEAAANLFGMLHQLDAMAVQQSVNSIGVATVPHHGLGIAINDRLARASAPR
ncbi:MAG: L-threonylcarbamoyladenylate synthase [Paracoccaceae bacterium]|jgi:L-threonylcarbamoyladenylate synthase